MEIKDKIAIVTGASNGIGNTTAKYLHNKGAQVYIADIDTKNGYKLSNELGDRSSFIEVDVTKKVDRENLINRVIDDSSTIDILINNAGGALHSEREMRRLSKSDFIMYGEELNLPTFELNLFSVRSMMDLVILYMKDNEEGGSIINMSSVNAGLSLELPIYSAAKAALEHTTKLYGRQYGKNNIRINAIRSGSVATEDTLKTYRKDPEQEKRVLSIMPSNKIGTTDDIVRLVSFIIQNEFMTGSVIPLDGGFSEDNHFFRIGEV